MIHQFIASGFIITPDRTATLLIWHNKLQKWVQPGGHVDEGELPHEAALREVAEEVGLRPRIVNCGVDLALSPTNKDESQMPTPYAFFREVIPARKAEPEHIHMDLMYIMEHNKVLPATISERELADVAWFTRAQLIDLDTFESVRAMGLKLLVE